MSRSSFTADGGDKCTSADGVITKSTTSTTSTFHMSRSGNGGDAHRFSTHSLSRMATSNSSHRLIMPPMRAGSLTRGDSMSGGCRFDASAVAESDERADSTSSTSSPSPPPKPLRGHNGGPAASHYQQQCSEAQSALHGRDPAVMENGLLSRVVSYHASGSDSGNGSGDSAQSSAAGDPLDAAGGGGHNGCGGGSASGTLQSHRGGVHIKNPRFMAASASSATLKSFADVDYAAVERALLEAQLPALEVPTRFDLENFDTLLLPSMENRPLDNGALNTLRMMLSETGPRVLANHLTRVDIRLILELNAPGGAEETDGGAATVAAESTPSCLDCSTGIELVAMEHGEPFRRDLIERTECLRLLVAVTVLTCNCDDERADTLNKWIQVAVDTKTALGNLFGFCAIMLGLCMPQIQRLESAWHILRQRHTDSAFNFEAKLRPTLKCMNDCSNPQAPNTTVPHLLPYVLLRDRGIEDILGA